MTTHQVAQGEDPAGVRFMRTAQATEATTATLPLVQADGEVRARARRGLGIYFAVVVLLTGALDALILAFGIDDLALLTMLVPVTAAVAARLALHEGFADVSFRVGGRRGWTTILLAPLLPIAVGLVAYGVAWTAGLVPFAPPPAGELTMRLALTLLPSLILVSGEEIGWRGYMLTRLIDAGVPRPILASGLIWGLWHAPLVWGGVIPRGPSPALSTVVLVVMATGVGVVIARARLETGSVWAAVALHLAWNTVIQEVFDPLAGLTAGTGAGARLWVGETGILTALVAVAAAVVCSRGRWTILRRPPERDQAPAQHTRWSDPVPADRS
jgi:membrane protease YdiL (CAAX protease family)